MNIAIAAGKFVGKIVVSSVIFGLMIKGSNIVVNQLDKIIDDNGKLKSEKII